MNRLHVFKQWVSQFTDVTIPPKCANCRVGGQLICDGCRDRIEWLEGCCCERCGKPVFASVVCRRCQLDPPVVDRIRSAAFFVPPVVEFVHQFKYYNQFALGKQLGQMMSDRWDEHFYGIEFDVILPIPLTKKREKMRGYNQAELLATAIGEQLELPVNTKLLLRRRETQPQARLSRHERIQNVKDAFQVNPLVKPPDRILLVDDVFTTGATLNAAATALKAGGAEFVGAYTFARPY